MGDFTGFHKKNYDARLKLVSDYAQLKPQQIKYIQNHVSEISSDLIENYLTDYGLPEGIATNFSINGKGHLIPMVIEEPSVIAAASNGATMLTSGGGISAKAHSRILTGEIVLKSANQEEFIQWFNKNKGTLMKVALGSHPSIQKYGGVRDVALHKIDDTYVSVELYVDVGDAMGANTINTMLEAVSTYIQEQLETAVLMSILSNYGDYNVVTASGIVPFRKLQRGEMSGKETAKRIAEASYIAQQYPKRAATHNKGIMNGIDAVLVATGNDWRAVESAVHSFASRDGQYRGLSKWRVTDSGLHGKIELPIPSGIIGGATRVLEMSKINYQILDVNNALQFMEILASVGLAQNLAALKALVTDGIQQGHMKLQLKSLALSAGASPDQVPTVVEQLQKLPAVTRNLESAKKIVKNINH